LVTRGCSGVAGLADKKDENGSMHMCWITMPGAGAATRHTGHTQTQTQRTKVNKLYAPLALLVPSYININISTYTCALSIRFRLSQRGLRGRPQLTAKASARARADDD